MSAASELRAKNVWLVYFEDYDVRPERFTDEECARKRFANVGMSHNCHLYKLVESDAGLMSYAAALPPEVPDPRDAALSEILAVCKEVGIEDACNQGAVDAVRQLAQVAITESGNSEKAVEMLKQRDEALRLRNAAIVMAEDAIRGLIPSNLPRDGTCWCAAWDGNIPREHDSRCTAAKAAMAMIGALKGAV
jgi:hypothetical protein